MQADWDAFGNSSTLIEYVLNPVEYVFVPCDNMGFVPVEYVFASHLVQVTGLSVPLKVFERPESQVLTM